MAKQLTSPKYIFKIHSSRLKQSKWDLTLSVSEAAQNEELIKLSDSQIMRFINDINGTNQTEIDNKVKEIRKRLKELKKQEKSPAIKKEINSLYDQLNQIQFIPEYLCVIMDKDSEFKRACKGFKVNGLKYKRFVGTTNGVKKKTIVFVCETNSNGKEVYAELCKRADNGRNLDKELVPAKFEAYKSLMCSSSLPVSAPKGVLVVKDCFTKFYDDYINLDDSETDEPIMTLETNKEIEINTCDGFGLMLPSLAERWSKDIKEDYVFSGCCIRNSFCKGMVFTFDFIDFANKYSPNNYMVTDVWGNQIDIRNVELIITESILKLWSSYDSVDHYLRCCEKNGYTFGITKIVPKTLDNVRNLNYQFIQSYNLSDDDIYQLALPTINEIKSVMGNDVNKTILFLKGMGITADNVNDIENDFVKAIMINPKLLNDPFVRNKIYYFIKKRITEAKIGTIRVNGNFAIISNDPVIFCQAALGLEVTGLLKKGECWLDYWVNKGVNKVVSFRAPMTCHNNIRMLNIVPTDEKRYWYRYMSNVCILNGFDSTAAAENGADYDGDMFFTTNNPILLDKFRPTPALQCVQRTAKKQKVTEESLMASNLNGFGDDIGVVTNHATTMYDVMSNFEPDSEEYKTLEYRIMCSELYQQNAIDRVKGIVTKPMPKYWYNKDILKIKPDDNEQTIKFKQFNQNIVANKKPYFMTYIYPDLMRKYKKYIKDTNEKCLYEFNISFEKLLAKENKSDRENEFIRYYYLHLPVSDGNCVMNRLCRLVEAELDGIRFIDSNEFDYSILKSDCEYSEDNYKQIYNLYEYYKDILKVFSQRQQKLRGDKGMFLTQKKVLQREFEQRAYRICNNKYELCNIVLDMVYSHNNSKQFAWDICGDVIIDNLLKANNYKITYLTKQEDGDIEYCGEYFVAKEKMLKEINRNE